LCKSITVQIRIQGTQSYLSNIISEGKIPGVETSFKFHGYIQGSKTYNGIDPTVMEEDAILGIEKAEDFIKTVKRISETN
jgi:hypothetical protein